MQLNTEGVEKITPSVFYCSCAFFISFEQFTTLFLDKIPH